MPERVRRTLLRKLRNFIQDAHSYCLFKGKKKQKVGSAYRYLHFGNTAENSREKDIFNFARPTTKAQHPDNLTVKQNNIGLCVEPGAGEENGCPQLKTFQR